MFIIIIIIKLEQIIGRSIQNMSLSFVLHKRAAGRR
jgi:hypothetical protein